MSSIPEKDKEYHALLLSHGNASYLYHNLDIEPTEQDFKEWLDGLVQKSNLKYRLFSYQQLPIAYNW